MPCRSLPRAHGKNVLMWLVIKIIKWTRREFFKIQKWNAYGVHMPLSTSNLIDKHIVFFLMSFKGHSS